MVFSRCSFQIRKQQQQFQFDLLFVLAGLFSQLALQENNYKELSSLITGYMGYKQRKTMNHEKKY